jgi:hypothetical protein
MTLYNLDLIIYWELKNDKVKIVEVHLLHQNYPDLLNLLSGKVFKLMVEDIENYELKKRMDDDRPD